MPDHVPNTVLYNENLEPPHNTTTVPDSRGGLISGEALIAQEVGWKWAPPDPEAQPGLVRDVVKYGPLPDATVASEPDYDAKTVTELQDELRDRGLSVTGNKGELIDRLTVDDADDQSDDKAQEG